MTGAELPTLEEEQPNSISVLQQACRGMVTAFNWHKGWLLSCQPGRMWSLEGISHHLSFSTWHKKPLISALSLETQFLSKAQVLFWKMLQRDGKICKRPRKLAIIRAGKPQICSRFLQEQKYKQAKAQQISTPRWSLNRTPGPWVWVVSPGDAIQGNEGLLVLSMPRPHWLFSLYRNLR